MAGFEKVLYQLQGDEPPKKWILWKKDVNKKIVTKTPDWKLVFSLLINLTNKAASTVIYNAFFALNISEGDYVKLTWGEYAPFCNKKNKKKLLAFATKADGSDMNAIKSITLLFMEEILFRLEELIFGTNMIRRNVYKLLQRLIRHYKVDPNQGIKKWQTCINQLNSYIFHVSCYALENCCASKV